MSDAMASDWYYAKQSASDEAGAAEQIGPLAWEQLYRESQSGAFGPDDLVWHPLLPQWVPASQIDGLFRAPATAVATPQPMVPPGNEPVQPGAVQPEPVQPEPVRPATARAEARARRSVLPWLIPLIALVLVGAVLGAYFGFVRDRGDEVATGVDTTAVEITTTSSTAVKTGEAAPLIDTVAVAPTVLDVLHKSTTLSLTPAGGSSTIDSHGLVISAPAGAVSAETTVEIRTLVLPYHMEEGTEPTGPNSAVCAGPVYDLGPEGLTFDKPITITLPYDEAALPPGFPEEDVAFAYWNGREWTAHAGLVDAENNTVTVQLERFDGLIETTIAGVVIVGGIILYTGKVIWDKLSDPERINTDAIMNGTAPQWITPDDPTVDSFAKTAVLKVPGDKDNPVGPSVPLSDPAGLGRLLEEHAGKTPFISFAGKNVDGGDLDLLGRYSKDRDTNWQKPADYFSRNNARGDCTDVTNAVVSVLSNLGYPAKAVFGYATDKNSPHVWVEVLVGDKPYFVDDNGRFAPLNEEEFKKAGFIRADPEDERNAMWDQYGQEPYGTDWWKEYLEVDLNGKWAGTLVFTDIKLSPEAQAELDKMAENPPEELEGCDLSSIGAILEQLKGKPCPLSLDITAKEGGTGSAILFIDFSALGEAVDPQEPAQVPLTWKDRTITISSSEDDQATTLTGTASKRGKEYVMTGTMTAIQSQDGKMVYTLFAEWNAVKQ